MKVDFLRSKLRALPKFRLIRTPSAATRKVMAAIFVLTSIVIVSWAVFRSYREQSGGENLGASEPLLYEQAQALSYRVTILSVDEVTRIAQVKPQVINETDKIDSIEREIHFKKFPPMRVMLFPFPGSDTGVFANWSVHDPSPHLNLIGGAIPRLYFGPLILGDLGQQFGNVGVAAFAFLNPEKEWPISPKNSVGSSPASPLETMPIRTPPSMRLWPRQHHYRNWMFLGTQSSIHLINTY